MPGPSPVMMNIRLRNRCPPEAGFVRLPHVKTGEPQRSSIAIVTGLPYPHPLNDASLMHYTRTKKSTVQPASCNQIGLDLILCEIFSGLFKKAGPISIPTADLRK